MIEKRLLFILFFIQISLVQFGQIIADHTVVDQYDKIPPQYIDAAKKMLVNIAGISHSIGYRNGAELLELLDPKFQVLTYSSYPPPARSDQFMRIGRHYPTGETEFYISPGYIAAQKNFITEQYNAGNPFHVFGLGWCYTMTWVNDPGGTVDPVYRVRWAGSSEGGPQGSLRWGLDSGDQVLTGNSISMDTYLGAVEQYIQYCRTNGYPTKAIFTTGPVDGNAGSENGYQREIKHDYVRNYVAGDATRILFDYADILCWNDSGQKYISNWNDGGTIRPHANIHPENLMDYDASWNIIPIQTDALGEDHIGEVGALRIAKAMWWMLARIAGWDGVTDNIPVTGITLTGAGGATTITADNGTLQLSAAVAPANATNKTVTWSVTNGTGQATISSTGLVTALTNGTVTARATSSDGSGIYGTLLITISNQVLPVIPVTGITLTGAGGSSLITTDNGSLQLTAMIAPTNATNQSVTWSVTNGTGQATISSTGLVTALTNGTVTARATANDGSGIYGTLPITISNQVIPVTGITLAGAGGSSLITSDNGSLQLTATVSPTNATNQAITWSLTNGTGQATISTSGLVTALTNGTVTARATANDGSGIYGTLPITISNQVIPVTGITLAGAGGSSLITSDNGSLQLTATVAPANATNQAVTWTVANGTGQATISTSGLVTALTNGTVTARATASDGSGIYGTLPITISNQVLPVIPVTGITLTGGSATITVNGTLQLSATVTPTDATNQSVTWSVTNGTGQATISSTGLVTALTSGVVTARATANDGSGIYGTLPITISENTYGGQIIADHTVVDKYDDIPATYIDEVKKMLVCMGGESSNATGYRRGLELLELYNSVYQVLTYTREPLPASSGSYLRFGQPFVIGEQIYTSASYINTIKTGVVRNSKSTAGNPFAVFGFDWGYEMSWTNPPGGGLDPVFKILWAGGSDGGPEGNRRWGLDAEDQVLTGNSVSMDTYFAAWEGYNLYCENSGIDTKFIYSTGSVDSYPDRAYQRELKHDYIRAYVASHSNVILFDYADILCYSNSGVKNTVAWNDGGTLRPHAQIHPDNLMDYDASWNIIPPVADELNIGEVGALRIAKAMWWLLARIAGWDGVTDNIPVTGITLTGAGGSSLITSDNGSLQLTATVSPTNATNQAITWSLTNGTGQATISTSGLVTALTNGTVTARATANDGSGIYGTLPITISNQVIPVTGITLAGAGGSSLITSDNGSLQLTATVAPANATNQAVTWTVANGTGQATISTSGLVTALTNGTVTARATASDGSGIYGTLPITISNQVLPVIPVTGITLTGGSATITVNGTLQLSATVTPTDATNQSVTWSVTNGTGQATISSTGLVTALTSGVVTARATANDGSGIYGTLPITISENTYGGQIIADHTVVDKYDDIPATYIDEVKKMLVCMGGESSNATGYRRGLELLELYNSVYQVLTYTREPLPASSGSYLRFGQPFVIGEQIYTSASYINTIKTGVVRNSSTAGNPFAVFGFDWGYEMSWTNPPGGGLDPVFKILWAGGSDGGPEGNRRWGLDAEDQVLTGNSVSMDTYFAAWEGYNLYCENSGIDTKFIYSTGSVDSYPDRAYQRELKHDYIRAYVASHSNVILFDYADILCYSNSGVKNTVAWNDGGTLRPHAQIHPDNLMDYDASWNIIPPVADELNIGEVGALRIAKAMWWMLARIAGWDGSTSKGSSVIGKNEAKTTIEFPEQEILPEHGILVYPNPTEGLLSIESAFNGEETCTIDLINISGQVILNQRLNVVGGKVEIDLSNVNSGYYLLRLRTDRSIQFLRVVKH